MPSRYLWRRGAKQGEGCKPLKVPTLRRFLALLRRWKCINFCSSHPVTAKSTQGNHSSKRPHIQKCVRKYRHPKVRYCLSIPVPKMPHKRIVCLTQNGYRCRESLATTLVARCCVLSKRRYIFCNNHIYLSCFEMC